MAHAVPADRLARPPHGPTGPTTSSWAGLRTGSSRRAARIAGRLLAVVLSVATAAGSPAAPAMAETPRIDAPVVLVEAGRVPDAVRALPATTRQAVRVVRSRVWCARAYCTRIEAWQRTGSGRWARVLVSGKHRYVRAQIGPNGFDKRRQGDGRTPTGVYGIKTTFSTDASNPGTLMRWRQRKPTSVVWTSYGPNYNTWIERRGETSGDRPAMRYGFWVNYNNARMAPGVGKRPVTGKGSGIFVHAVSPDDPYGPSQGCVMTRPGHLRWMLGWLDPGSRPRVLLNR